MTSRISRRTFVVGSAAATAGTGLGLSPSATAAAQPQRSGNSGPRPNILLAIADDWGYPDAGAYGYQPAAGTPTFDRIAQEGALFTRAFCAAPSCTPSRSAILTGQAPHRLEEGANLHGYLPAKFDEYPDLLEQAGYRIGKMRKGWGPGGLVGRTRNPAGPNFGSFEGFLSGQPDDTPFCFWFGSHDPHRPYSTALGQDSGIDPNDVRVPPYLVDTPEVRDDIVNYLAEVQRFDQELAGHLRLLDERGLSENTLVVVTGDHGWPFPRGKANAYDAGTRVPLTIRWPGRVQPGMVSDHLTVLTDLAPTFLQVAGLDVPPDMTGESLLATLTGTSGPREFVVIERERHGMCREPNLGYPIRALRTEDWLYIRNYFPERWPAGDPDFADGWRNFGDIDNGPTKTQLLANRRNPEFVKAFHLATSKRGAEELYYTKSDPHNMVDLADDSQYSEVKAQLSSRLLTWMDQTADPRAENPREEFWDDTYYTGPRPPTPLTAPLAEECVLAFDGGTNSSPVYADYTRLSPDDAWDADRGYGWIGGAPQSRDRGEALDALRRDFCNDTIAGTLRIAVPAGEHFTYLLVGDAGADSKPTIVTVDGQELARSEYLIRDAFSWLEFTLDGGSSGRVVDLVLTSEPRQHWHVVALALRSQPWKEFRQ